MAAVMLTTALKTKKCRGCSSAFMPVRPTQVVCGLMCGLEVGRKKRLAKEAKAAREEKRADAPRKAALKTIPMLIKEAQVEFNRFIRLRDQIAGFPCISSGRPLDWSGNAVDAGHYRSTGAASHLRFNEANCHAQSKHDNQFLAGNAVDYRINLVRRIGLPAVLALEADNTPHKWTREELIAIKATYAAKCRALKKEMA